VLFCHILLKHPINLFVQDRALTIFRSSFYLALITVAVLAFMKTPHLPFNLWDKASHAITFFALIWLADRSYPDQYPTIHPLKWIGLFFYGLWIEGMQSMLPYREASLLDLLANLVGMFTYIALIFLVKQNRS
jgi:VanZ family protein